MKSSPRLAQFKDWHRPELGLYLSKTSHVTGAWLIETSVVGVIVVGAAVVGAGVVGAGVVGAAVVGATVV